MNTEDIHPGMAKLVAQLVAPCAHHPLLKKAYALSDIHHAIDVERDRQDEKWGWPNAGLASVDVHKKNTILGEEVGEVARAILEQDWANLKVELVQVAAVCVAWLESIEEFGR